MRLQEALIAGLVMSICSIGVASAWTGPTATPPNNNASAPLNVSTVAQTKNGNIGVDGLAVFGNTLLGGSAGSNAYLNFGGNSGSSGYGIWDNNGTLEFANSGGPWQPLQTIINNDITNSNPTFNTVTATQYCIGASSCITTWPSGGTDPWTTGTYGISYSAGNVGIGTPAKSNASLIVYNSSSGIQANLAGTYALYSTSAVDAGDFYDQAAGVWLSNILGSTFTKVCTNPTSNGGNASSNCTCPSGSVEYGLTQTVQSVCTSAGGYGGSCSGDYYEYTYVSGLYCQYVN